MMEKGSLTPWAKPASGDEKILIVDDDARVLDLLRITLTGRGFEVVVAASGEEALRRILSAQPDLVVMNTRLPGSDGLKILDEIRNTSGLAGLPVVLISSDATSGAKLQGFRHGADDYVSKPFSPRELILRIRKILDRVGESRVLQRRVRELETAVLSREKSLDETRGELRGRLFRVGSSIGELQRLSRANDMDELLSRFIAIVTSYLDIDVGALFLRDEAAGDLTCRTIRGWEHRSQQGLRISVAGPLAREISGATRPLSLQSVRSLPEMAGEAAHLLAAGLRYAHPVRGPDGVDGMICIGLVGGRSELDPVDVELLRALADAVDEAVGRQRSRSVLEGTFLETAGTLIGSLERCYPGFEGHSERVARHAAAVAEAHGCTPEEVRAIRLGALLHDLGLAGIYDHLGRRTHPLPTDDRRRLVEAPLRAAETLAAAGLLETVVGAVRHHHEHWDGSGYPEGLGAESIPIGARIVAVANAFDALTHERPHRPAFSIDEAVATLLGESGRVFDPQLVDLFLAVRVKEASPA